jgi:putative ABC transport system permease protein
MSLPEFLRRVRLLFGRNRATAELEDEMRLHRALRTEAIREQGATEPDATTAARRQFGNPLNHQEASRDAWGFGSLDDLGQDIRYAVRRLRQRPGFTVAVIGVLALGIGATTAMFSAVDAAMLRPLPFRRPNELVALRDIGFPKDLSRFTLGRVQQSTAPRPHQVRLPEAAAMGEIFSHIAGYAAGGLNLGDASHPLRVRVGVVTADFFATLGVVPFRGRTFVAEEVVADGRLSAMISYGLWQRQYGGRDILGTPILLGDKTYLVVGVMPKGFSFPQQSDLWIPMTIPLVPDVYEPLGGAFPTEVIARLAPGVTIAAASPRLLLRWEQDVIEGLAPGTQSGFEDDLANVRTHGVMTPLQRNLVGDHGRALMVLLGATGMLLLIACANVTHLLLSQASGRRREIAIREVLGATRGRVIRQLLAESVLLSLSGSILGIALAPATAGLLTRLLPPEVSGVVPIQVDLRVLGFASVLALMTGIGLGLWPAFGVTRTAPAETIKTGGARGTSAAGRRARAILIASELALTVTLLISGVLMLRSFRDLMSRDTGLQTDHVGTLQMAFPIASLKPIRPEIRSFDQLGDMWGLDRQRRRVDEMVERLQAMPGITAAAAVDNLPLRGPGGTTMGTASVLFVEGSQPLPNDEMRSARTAIISNDYFRAMGIPRVRGRLFAVSDDSLAPKAAVINRALAEQYWPGLDPIGRRFGFYNTDSSSITVVGMVGNVRDKGLDEDPTPQVYFPIHQSRALAIVALVARGTLPPRSLLAALQNAVHAVNPSQAVYSVQMMNDVIDRSVAPRRTNTLLLTLFAGLALVLAILGVYSVVAYGVHQRARELGIRAALGATGHDLVAMVAREMAWSSGLGTVAGLAGAWALSRLLTTFLFGISAHDPVTFVAVPLMLLVATGAATLIPARRVLRVNPAEVLRAE